LRGRAAGPDAPARVSEATARVAPNEFGLWHLAPQSRIQASNPGGSTAFVAVAIVLGLGWGWVARRTGSIRWVVVSHVLLDFGGLGAPIDFR
jgi:membrane protease YdiL (CAAX protease family)